MGRCLNITFILLVILIAVGFQAYNQQDVLFKLAITSAFSNNEYGVLCLKYLEKQGKTEKYGISATQDSTCSATLLIHKEKEFFSTIATSGPNIGVGEAYMWKYWSVDDKHNSDAIRETIYHMLFNQLHRERKFAVVMEYIFSFKHLYRLVFQSYFMTKTKKDDKEQISHHYDVGNDFYETFLGPKLSGYSCGIFKKKHDSRDQAQDNKWDIIIKKAQIEQNKNLKVVDIGCGWGYFPSYINNKTNNSVVGITISKQQFAFMNHKWAPQIKNKQILFDELDYRDLKIKYGIEYFDRAVSIGMLEHVGYDNLPQYFQSVWDVLKPDTYFLLHYICRTDVHPLFRKLPPRSRACEGANFISKYIFPGGCVLPPDWVYEQADKIGFKMMHQEFYGKHYAKTLHIWRNELRKNKDIVMEKYDEDLYRAYEFYFATSETVFMAGRVELVQQLFYKPPTGDVYTTKWSHKDTFNPNY
eukprot:230337_1